MKKTNGDIMLDLETFGTGYNAMIVQIGACYFDRYTGEIPYKFFHNVELKHSESLGFKIDVSTVNWWLAQSEEAKKQLFEKPPVQLETILVDFNKWLPTKCNIWSHATFDFVLLSNHYRVTGIQPAFKYWQARDLRTLVDLAGIDTRDYSQTGTAHNALDDCIFQVGYAVDAFNILKKDGDEPKNN